MTLLVAEHVSKRFDGIAALSDVSIEVGSGEMVALIGPNGAGKTTLFNCLSGVIRPNSGRITFDGHAIDARSSHQRARLGIARTFQRIELFTGMSVRDHLLVADRARTRRGSLLTDLLGRSKPTRDEHERCDAMLELVGLADDADKPAGALSLGRGRLVELARALMCDPKLLFLDEPSSGLDHHETEEMGTALQTVQADREVAILLCEHDVPFVERLATRTYVLDVGHLIASGDTATVLSDPHVRAAYLGHTA